MRLTLHMPERTVAYTEIEQAVEGALAEWDGYPGNLLDLEGEEGFLLTSALDALLASVRDRLSDLGYEYTPQANIQEGLEGFEDKIEVACTAETTASAKARRDAENIVGLMPDPRERVYCWSFPIPENA